MKLLAITFIKYGLFIALFGNLNVSVSTALAQEFNCKFKWSGISSFLLLSQNGHTLVCMVKKGSSAQLSVRALSGGNSVTGNINVPEGPDYVDDITLLDISGNGRYLAFFKTRFISNTDNPNEEYSYFSRYFIADLKTGVVGEVSKGFPRNCSSEVGRFSPNSEMFVFGISSAFYKTDPERKNPPVYRGCDGKYVGYYSLNLSKNELKKLGNEVMSPASLISGFYFNTDGSKVLHRGNSIRRALVTDINDGESSVIKVGGVEAGKKEGPQNMYGYIGFLDDQTVLGLVLGGIAEAPTSVEGEKTYSLVASAIDGSGHKVLKSLTIDNSSLAPPFGLAKQSPNRRYFSYINYNDGYAVKGLTEEGTFILDVASGKVRKLSESYRYQVPVYTEDHTGMVIIDSERMLYKSTGGAESYQYSLADKKFKLSSGGGYLGDVHVAGNQVFYTAGTNFGDCGPTPGKTLYTIPLQNGQPKRVSKKLNGTCGVFMVKMSDDSSKIFYASFQEPGSGFGIYQVDITSEGLPIKQLF